MTMASLAILAVIVGVVLLVAEALLPTHGVLGVAGIASIAVAIGACFYVNQWIGLSVLVAVVLTSPLVGAAFVKIYPHTPIGRRMVLQPPASRPAPPPIHIGQTGVAVSELRPMGECDFGDQRIEVISEYGIIPSGKPVKVVAFNNGRPAVRMIA